MSTPPSREQVRHFCRRHRLELGVLFGSQAQGRATPLSDVDLGVWVGGRELTWQRRLALVNAALQHFRRNDLDLTFLNHVNPLVQWEVASTGQVLYEAWPGRFLAFQLRAFKRHNDARKIYRWERAYVLRYVKGGRLAAPA